MKRLLLVLGILVLAGCSEATYGQTLVDGVVQGELPVRIETDTIRIPVGTIAAARFRTLNTDGNPMISNLRSEDSSVLQVDRAVGDDMYAFLPVRMGRTIVTVLADGVPVRRIDAEVVDQGAPP
jgi:hypothetical protein